jgi:CTP synthase
MRLGAQDIQLLPGSLASMLYGGATSARERFRHRYEVEPAFVEKLRAAGLIFSGQHPTRPIMQVLELPRPRAGEGLHTINPATTQPHRAGAAVQAAGAGSPPTASPITHPYFIGGQFHPELTSRPLRPQPMFMGLIAAAVVRRYGTVPTTEAFGEQIARWTGPARAERAVHAG